MDHDIALPDFPSCNACLVRAKCLRGIHLFFCCHNSKITDDASFFKPLGTSFHRLAGLYPSVCVRTFSLFTIYEYKIHCPFLIFTPSYRLVWWEEGNHNDIQRMVRLDCEHHCRSCGGVPISPHLQPFPMHLWQSLLAHQLNQEASVTYSQMDMMHRYIRIHE